MAKTLVALETEVRSHLDRLPMEARARWRTLRVVGGVIRVVGVGGSAASAFAVLANTGPAVVALPVSLVVLSLGVLVTRRIGTWITLLAVKDAVRALEASAALASVGGSTSVALPPPTRSVADHERRYPAPRERRTRHEAADRDAPDFDDAG
ncbi:MAG: hypothetical protein HYS27_20885 [Deltaproteobacteria bacterium]|nr:hypothetical protein [Deltaproteobacteria bacterium]